MSETVIKFKREDLEGVVAVGSYLIDAAKRFGIRFEEDCIQETDVHYCSMVIEEGAENLTPLTLLEDEHFKTAVRRDNERLACQAKIDRTGEIIVMTDETKKAADDASAEVNNDKYRKDFADLPLDKKIAELAQLEAIALSETFSFIMNSPYLIIDKVMDVMAEFGIKKEEEAKNAARPAEHKTADSKTKTASKKSAPTPESAPRKSGTKPKAAE